MNVKLTGITLPRMGVLRYRKNSKIWDTSNNCHNCPKKIEKFDVTLH